MKRLEDFTDAEIEALRFEAPNMDEVILPSNLNDCSNVSLCVPTEEFCQIEKCKLCGRML